MKQFDYERYLRMAVAAEARGFLKTTFLLADIDCGMVTATFKHVEFKEASCSLKNVFRCCISVSFSDGVTEDYIVIGTIDKAGIDCLAIIRRDGDTGSVIYWDDGDREHEDHLQTVKHRREQRRKQTRG